MKGEVCYGVWRGRIDPRNADLGSEDGNLSVRDYKGRRFAHTGLLHSRMAILMPPPHVREQVPKGLQTPQVPSTGVASASLVMHRPCLQCCSGGRKRRG